MSQLLSSAALRQLKALTNSIQLVQTNLGGRYFSAIANKNALTKRFEPSILKSTATTISQVPQRTLYDQDSLDLDKVKNIRDSKQQLYQAHKDRYIERLSDYLKGGNVQSILKDDVNNLIGLAENEQHLDLLEKIITSAKSDLDFASSGWGTAVVRLYCTLDQIDRAYNNMKDQERYGDFFNQYTAYKVALTMLYNAGRHEHVLEIYNLAREKLNKMDTDSAAAAAHTFHIPGLALVAFASLAKINTPAALEQAEKMFNELDSLESNVVNNYTRLRLIMFVSHMALKQDKPTLAINLISDAKGRNYVGMREMKTLSLLKLKRFEDVVYHIRESITRSKESQSTREKLELILREVFEALEANISEIQDEATRQTLEDTLVEIKQHNMIGETTLESIVFAPLKPRMRYNDRVIGKQQSMDAQRYQNRSYNRYDSRSDDILDGENRYAQRNPRQMRYQSRDGTGGNRRGNFTDRRAQSKSYFEDDGLVDEDDNAISTQKRFR